MCVRLCDGYYFPISYATTREHFARDAKQCERSCGSPARLYAYENPGQEPEQMEDLRGSPYASLKTAFQFRQSYDAACTCRPQPWDEASLARHQRYAALARQSKLASSIASAAAPLRRGERYASVGGAVEVTTKADGRWITVPQTAAAAPGARSVEEASQPPFTVERQLLAPVPDGVRRQSVKPTQPAQAVQRSLLIPGKVDAAVPLARAGVQAMAPQQSPVTWARPTGDRSRTASKIAAATAPPPAGEPSQAPRKTTMLNRLIAALLLKL